MTAKKEHMYFIIVENFDAGSICYIEEKRYLSKFVSTTAEVPVTILGSSLETSVLVSKMQQLTKQEAELLQALGEKGERLRAFREREGLDHALSLTKGSRVTVQVQGEWCEGVIRYIGSIATKRYLDPITGTFFGIELQGKDKGKGQNEAWYVSKKHFTCSKDCGVASPFTKVRPYAPKPPFSLQPQQGPGETLAVGDRVTFFINDDHSRNGMVLALEEKDNKTLVVISPDMNEKGESGESISIPLESVIREELLSPGPSSKFQMDGADSATGMPSDAGGAGHLSLDSVVEVELNPGKTVYGTVRWIGKLPRMEGTRVGLELEEETGVSDGTFKGELFFSCLPKRGLFVKLDSCRPDSRFQTTGDREGTLTKSMTNIHTERNRAPRTVVLDSVAPLSSEQVLQVLVGRMKGIQGHCNSCYMDSALFSLFSCSSVLDSLLFKSTKQQDALIQTTLLQQIVNPLRSNGFVPSENVMKLRRLLQDGGHSDHTFTTEEKDPEEFLTLIMHRILCLEPLLKLSAGEKVQENYCYQIFLDQNHSLILPTVQQLLEHSFHSAGLRLAEVPSCLILQMPRFGKKFKMFNKIIPSLELDISDLLSESPRECVLCGQLAYVECTDCFKDPAFGSTGFKQFCMTCSKQVHSHPQRKSHYPSHLRLPEGYPPSYALHAPPREKLQLFAVLCIETSHYVSFVRHGPQTHEWIFFDSMSDREGDEDGFNIPMVRACPEVGRYLQMPLAELSTQVPRDMEGVAKRLFCDAYMYLYQSPSMALYR